jgi:NADH-quinone oxidoreductase subunit N
LSPPPLAEGDLMTAPVAAVPALLPALPELVLASGSLLLVLIGAVVGACSTRFIQAMTVALLVLAGLLVVNQPDTREIAFHGAFIVDGFARFMKVLALAASALSLIMAQGYLNRHKVNAFEFPILVLLSTLGMMVMISAHDLIALYLGLELSSLALYVIASFRRDDLKSTEAGLKYFVLGALSSGMLLYGASLIYGFSGSVEFTAIAKSLNGHASSGVIFGLAFLMAGLAFKISAVPFHMWTPDVYEGSPTPVTTFFASAPKLAAMALTVRVVMTAFPDIADQWRQIIVFIALGSMGLGAFAAIGQANIKRLLAYSSIGHIGFALVGLSAGTDHGVQGVVIYMALYVVMTLGAFACVLGMRRGDHYVETIDELAGLGRTNPGMAFGLAMIMFSLAGIPPLAGFFAKWYVFVAAVEAKLYALAVIGVLTSVVGAFYYLRIVKIMYFDEPKEAFAPLDGALKSVLLVSTLLVFFFWLSPAPLVNAALMAAQSLH